MPDKQPISDPPLEGVGSNALVRRVLALEKELAEITKVIKVGWWECQCCKVLREPNWFSYRVRGHNKETWIEPACAMCAREMFSAGPFPPPNDLAQATASAELNQHSK